MVETITSDVSLSDGESFTNKIIDASSGAIIEVAANNFEIRNVGFKGRHPAMKTNIIKLAVPDRDATGVVENLYLGDGVKEGSKGGIYVNAFHSGELTFRNVNVQHISNNGLYATSPGEEGNNPGLTHVENSYFKNCNISGIRVGNSVAPSRVTGCVVYADSGTPPCDVNCSAPGTVAPRCIWARDGHVIVEDCDLNNNGINGWDEIEKTAGGSFETRNTRIGESANHYIPEGVPQSAREAATGGTTPPSEAITSGSNNLTVRPSK